MQRFILVRVFHSILALFAVSIVIYVLGRVSGDPVAMMLPPEASDEDFVRVRALSG
jgi:ABC-type dipeptide/oligopeptide/nickel transport system permease component